MSAALDCKPHEMMKIKLYKLLLSFATVTNEK